MSPGTINIYFGNQDPVPVKESPPKEAGAYVKMLT